MSIYIHEEQVHNLKDASLIVPAIMDLINPKSVVDIGCGLGTFLNIFKRHGVNQVLGVDGKWVNKDLLFSYINPAEFLEWNLEEAIKLEQKYDLVVSLEVAEHLSPKAANTFIKNLVNAGDVILFSAAIPNQGGQNHINEQWLTYWEEKFNQHEFILHDVIRPIFWENEDLFIWYKQNMVLFIHKDIDFKPKLNQAPMRNLVHADLYNEKVKLLNRYETVINGERSKTVYFMLLLKSFIGNKNYLKLRHLKQQLMNGKSN